MESGCFSRFIWPSRGGRGFFFCLTPPRPPPSSPERNRASLSGQTLAGLHATDGGREIVRRLECEQMSRGCHRTTVSLNFSSPLVFFFFFFSFFLASSTFQAFYFFSAANSVHHPACSFLQPHLSEALR